LPADIPAEPASPGHEGHPASPGKDDGPASLGHGSGAATPGHDGGAATPGYDSGAASPGHDGGAASPDDASAPAAPARQRRTGRNLPVAFGVGAGLGGLAILTLFTVKATFLLYMAVAVGIALWELSRAMAARGIRLPVVPVAVGGAVALALAYWSGERAMVACLPLTVIAVLAWRLPGGAAGYLRDVTAGVFALGYLPLMACFVGLMLAVPDGPRRTLVFLILAVCSDVGGYFAGILVGRHPMAPRISPKKTWEGFGGSMFACVLGGAIALPILLSGAVWQGILVGVAVLAAATLGDLTESMIKRDLEIKDMGTVLPGHGGILDRIDSLLLSAPVVWLLLLVFIPAHQH
jgi:phosphatidate cytidylyltransferase